LSKELVEQQMRRFLESGEPETMCVSGAWGVGKTFLWSHVLRTAKKAKKIKLDGYSYVSLFGISDLEQLKHAIFENRTPKEQIGEPITPLSIEQNFRRYSAPLLKLAEELPWIGSAAKNAAPLLTMSISKQIVCIDDLERRGEGLTIRDVLGFATFLKEQRACQVIVLTNYSDLQGEDKDQYDQYQEKVFDRTLTFAPDAAYCADIALPDDKTGMRDRVIQLGISNIRIINKIRKLVHEVQPVLASFHPSVFDSAVHTLVLAGWMKYTKGAPPFSFLTNRHTIGISRAIGKDANIDPKLIQWNDTIDAYRFGEPDALDRALISAIDNGFLDEDAIKTAAEALHRDAKVADGNEKRRNAWRKFHGSFKNDGDEVVKAFVDAYGSQTENVGAAGLDHVLKLLRALGRNDEADQLIDKYVAAHAGNPRAFDLTVQREFGEAITDSKLLAALQTQFENTTGTADPVAAIKRIERDHGFNKSDLEVARQVTTAQLLVALETAEDNELKNFIKECRQLANTSAYGIIPRGIVDRLNEALVILAKRNDMNDLRVRKLGIDRDNPPAAQGDVILAEVTE